MSDYGAETLEPNSLSPIDMEHAKEFLHDLSVNGFQSDGITMDLMPSVDVQPVMDILDLMERSGIEITGIELRNMTVEHLVHEHDIHEEAAVAAYDSRLGSYIENNPQIEAPQVEGLKTFPMNLPTMD